MSNKEFKLPKAQPIETMLINLAKANGGKVGLSNSLLNSLRWPRIVPGKNGKKRHAKFVYADATDQERKMAERSTDRWVAIKKSPKAGLGGHIVLPGPKSTVQEFLPLTPGLEPYPVTPQNSLVIRENYALAQSCGYFGIIIGTPENMIDETCAYSAVTSKRAQTVVNIQASRMFLLWKSGKLPTDWEQQAYAPELRLMIEKHESKPKLN